MNVETMNINTLEKMVNFFPVGDEISLEDLAETVGVTEEKYQQFAKTLRRTYVQRTKVEFADNPVELSVKDALTMAKQMTK